MILSLIASAASSSWISFASQLSMHPNTHLFSALALVYYFVKKSMDASTSLDTETSTKLTKEHLKWFHNYVLVAYNSHKPYYEFLAFFQEGIRDGDRVIWKTDRTDYRDNLLNLGCQVTTIDSKTVFTLSVKDYVRVDDEKSRARRVWHYNRQVYLRNYMIDSLNNSYTQPLDISYREKVALIHKYAKRHRDEDGSRAMHRGLAGFIQYQLAHPNRGVDWKMYACYMIETHDEASVCRDYLQLMRGVLGMQLVFRDDDVQTVVIDMENNITKPREPCDFVLVWRMNPEVDIQLLKETLKVIPKQFREILTPEEYKVTEIPTAHKEQGNVLFHCLDQCLSFLRK
jgi:hypothetical protein